MHLKWKCGCFRVSENIPSPWKCHETRMSYCYVVKAFNIFPEMVKLRVWQGLCISSTPRWMDNTTCSSTDPTYKLITYTAAVSILWYRGWEWGTGQSQGKPISNCKLLSDAARFINISDNYNQNICRRLQRWLRKMLKKPPLAQTTCSNGGPSKF